MKLGEVLILAKGNLIDIQNENEYTIAGVQNKGAGVLNKRKVQGKELTMKKYQLIEENQLMWCKVDTKSGAFGVTKKENVGSLASTNMALAYIDEKKCLPEFIAQLFKFQPFHENITKYSSGSTNRKYLTPTQLFEFIEIPTLTIEEQRKWIQKLQSVQNSPLFDEVQSQLVFISQLREAFLREAMQGKLVSQDETDEQAEILLKKIKAEKGKLIAEKKLKKDAPIPEILADEVPYEIPCNWRWTRLGNCIFSAKDGPHFSPVYSTSGIPFISTRNISPEGIDFTTAKFVSEEYHETISRKCKPEKGDLLYTKGGTTGIARVNTYDLEFNVWVHVAVLKIDRKSVV